MYYLYKKGSKQVPAKMDYTFEHYKDFLVVAPSLTMKITGPYVVSIKIVSFDEVKDFLQNEDSYKHIDIYLQAEKDFYNVILLRKPGIRTLEEKDNYEIWTELIRRLDIRLEAKLSKKLYWSISHEYEKMYECLTELKKEYGKQIISMPMVTRVINIDQIVYPRTVCISYIRLSRDRKSKLSKSISEFGNDLVFYSIRKNLDQFLNDKNSYFLTGEGSDLIKSLPYDNLLKLWSAFHNTPKYFRDVTVILNLYEKGEQVNDYLQKEAI